MKYSLFCLALLGLVNGAQAVESRPMLLAQSSFDSDIETNDGYAQTEYNDSHSRALRSGTTGPAGITNASDDTVRVTLQKDYHWTANIGPAMSAGMGASNLMYSASGGYVWDFHPRMSAKIIGSAALPSSSDTARLFQLAVGPNVYLSDRSPVQGRSYATADVGYASARNNDGATNTGLGIGAGVGYEFAAKDNYRLNALVHGSLMTTTVGAGNPTVIGAQLGVDL